MKIDPHIEHLHAKYVYISKGFLSTLLGKRVIISNNSDIPVFYKRIGIFCVIVDKESKQILLFSHYSSGKLEQCEVKIISGLSSISVKELRSESHLSKPY